MRLATFVVVALLAVACGEQLPPLAEGTIREKQFVAAHWESGYDYECDYHYSFTKGGYEYGCHDVYEREHEWAEDAWRIKIEGCDPVGPERTAKCRSRWLWVNQVDFDRVAVGVHWPEPA